jgi:hypothetical protein
MIKITLAFGKYFRCALRKYPHFRVTVACCPRHGGAWRHLSRDAASATAAVTVVAAAAAAAGMPSAPWIPLAAEPVVAAAVVAVAAAAGMPSAPWIPLAPQAPHTGNSRG